MYSHMEAEIEKLTVQVAEQAEHRSGAQLLMTHPGVGAVTALATDVFLGDPQRFADGKALASYTGLIPQERSSGRRRRLGRISKQGNPLLRFLWNEAGAHAARRDPELRRFYRRKLVQKGLGKHAWRWPASWESGCGSCCETRSITKSSVVADRSKAVPSVRGCLKSAMVRIVTVRLIRLPASLPRKGVRRSHHGPS
jgi:Transposase IS116/IS110/IS902 family